MAICWHSAIWWSVRQQCIVKMHDNDFFVVNADVGLILACNRTPSPEGGSNNAGDSADNRWDRTTNTAAVLPATLCPVLAAISVGALVAERLGEAS